MTDKRAVEEEDGREEEEEEGKGVGEWAGLAGREDHKSVCNFDKQHSTWFDTRGSWLGLGGRGLASAHGDWIALPPGLQLGAARREAAKVLSQCVCACRCPRALSGSISRAESSSATRRVIVSAQLTFPGSSPCFHPPPNLPHAPTPPCHPTPLSARRLSDCCVSDARSWKEGVIGEAEFTPFPSLSRGRRIDEK